MALRQAQRTGLVMRFDGLSARGLVMGFARLNAGRPLAVGVEVSG